MNDCKVNTKSNYLLDCNNQQCLAGRLLLRCFFSFVFWSQYITNFGLNSRNVIVYEKSAKKNIFPTYFLCVKLKSRNSTQHYPGKNVSTILWDAKDNISKIINVVCLIVHIIHLWLKLEYLWWCKKLIECWMLNKLIAKQTKVILNQVEFRSLGFYDGEKICAMELYVY